MSIKGKEQGRRGKGAACRFPGITEAARRLGVDRSHLWRVLAGRRESRALSARYSAFVAARKAVGR